MFKYLFYLLSLITLVSCLRTVNPNIKLPSTGITEIIVLNKMDELGYDEAKKEVRIKNQEKIDHLIKNLRLSSDITTHVNTKEYYGLFSLQIAATNNTIFTYDILFTIYDGVIIVEHATNNLYRNDRLEVLVHRLFE